MAPRGLAIRFCRATSDAAWIARFGANRLMAHLRAGATAQAALKAALADAERSFAGLRRRPPAETCEMPFAAMMLAVESAGGFDALWFGDCAALVKRGSEPAFIVGDAFDKKSARTRWRRPSCGEDRAFARRRRQPARISSGPAPGPQPPQHRRRKLDLRPGCARSRPCRLQTRLGTGGHAGAARQRRLLRACQRICSLRSGRLCSRRRKRRTCRARRGTSRHRRGRSRRPRISRASRQAMTRRRCCCAWGDFSRDVHDFPAAEPDHAQAPRRAR